jgi:glycerol-3-phosphate O-acyltransferase
VPSFTNDAGALDPLGTGPIHESRVSLEKEKHLLVHGSGESTTFQVPDDSRITLDYQKNTAIHFFVPEALLATCLLTSDTADRTALERRALGLSRLFKFEFIYSAGDFHEHFTTGLRRFIETGLVEESNGRLVPTAIGAPRLRLLAELIANFVEGYAATTDALSMLLAGPMEGKEVVRQVMERTRLAFVAGKIKRAESRSKVLVENALALYEDLGVLVRTGDKDKQLALAPDRANQRALDDLLSKLRSFLIDQ